MHVTMVVGDHQVEGDNVQPVIASDIATQVEDNNVS